MFKKIFCLGLVASASASGSTASPAGLMRLRGGVCPGWKELTNQPAALDPPTTDNKIKIKTASKSDSPKVEASFIANAVGALKTAFKVSTSTHGVDLHLGGDCDGKVDFAAEMDHVVPGLKLHLSSAASNGKSPWELEHPKVMAEYNKGGITAGAIYKDQDVDLSATYSLQHDDTHDLQVGLDVDYDMNKGNLGDVNLAASYHVGHSGLTAVCHGLKPDNIDLTATHKLGDDVDLAGTFSTHDNKFSLGAQTKLCEDSHVNAVIDSDGHLTVGYDRKVSDDTALHAGLALDAHDSHSRKLGVSLTHTI